MSRAFRKKVAADTVNQYPKYPTPNTVTLNTNEIDISLQQPLTTRHDTYFEVYGGDVNEAVHYLYEHVREKKLQKLGVLNFASAKKPGGGFLNGAIAQEEALSYVSNLYDGIKDSLMYSENTLNPRRGVYADMAIYSQNVQFFKDQHYNYVQDNAVADVATIPAPNAGHAQENGVSKDDIQEALFRRMDLALALFAKNGCDCIILGAFGCGVFRNDPYKVAKEWHRLLTHRYEGVFEYVNFTILGEREIKPFWSVFKKLLD